MNWDNIKIYKTSKTEPDPSLEEILKKDYILVKLTDNSLYDIFQKEDLVRVKIQENISPETFVLLDFNGHLSLKKIRKDQDSYIVSQLYPKEEERVEKKDITIIGPATGILRV